MKVANKNIKVILVERLPKLGNIGDAVSVKRGFARNYLLPRNKALVANESNKKYFETRRGEIEAVAQQVFEQAEALAQVLNGVSLTVKARASDEGKLFGSISLSDLATALAEQGHKIDKKQIKVSETIRAIGEYKVTLQLHEEVAVIVPLTVVAA